MPNKIINLHIAAFVFYELRWVDDVRTNLTVKKKRVNKTCYGENVYIKYLLGRTVFQIFLKHCIKCWIFRSIIKYNFWIKRNWSIYLIFLTWKHKKCLVITRVLIYMNICVYLGPTVTCYYNFWFIIKLK